MKQATQLEIPSAESSREGMFTSAYHQLPRQQLVLTMAGVMLTILLAALDQTIVGTAMPRIIADLRGFEQYAWVITAYLVAQTAATPIVGKLTDIYSQKWIYIGGLILFVIASALCGLSQTMTQLVLFRGIQGIGAGTIMANSFTLTGRLFPPNQRGKYQGLLGAMFGVASVIGPTAGGYITDNLSWSWVFYVNIPLGVLVTGLFLFFFPHVGPAAGRRQIDFAGAGALLCSIVPLLLALTWAGKQYPWASVQIIGLLVFAACMAFLFIWIENRAADPILPLQLFRNVIFSISTIVVFLAGIGMFGTILFVPLFVQGVLGSSATTSGNILTPMMLSMVAGSIISGQLLSRAGGHYRIQGVLGLGLMAVGMFLLTTMGPDTSNSLLILNIVIGGVGLGVTFPLFTIAVQNALPPNLLGVATSSIQFFRFIGGSVGAALLGTVMINSFGVAFQQQIPPAVARAIPPDRLSELMANPEALLSPQAREQMGAVFSQLGPGGAASADQIMTIMRQALASSIHDVFVVGTIVIVVAWIACFFLREVPLQQGHDFHGE